MQDRNRVLQRFVQRVISRWTTRYRQASGVKRVKRLPPDIQQAALRLRSDDPKFRRDPRYRRDQIDWTGVHPEIEAFVKRLLDEMDKRFYPFYCFELVRSRERQEKLFAEGRSKARAGQSPHQFGLAADVIHSDFLWNLTKKEWAVIGVIGKEVARKCNVPIEWGGDWNFYDPAHWQLSYWKDWREYFRETGLDEWPKLRTQAERAGFRRSMREWKKARAG